MFFSASVMSMTVENGRKRSYSKTVSLQGNSVCSATIDETKSANSYLKNYEELSSGIKKKDISKVDQSLKFWVSNSDLDDALRLLIQSTDKYDEKTKSIMKKLLDKGADPNNQRGRIYASLAIEAIRYRDLDLLELLLKYGLDPNTKDKKGSSLFQIVLYQNNDCWSNLGKISLNQNNFKSASRLIENQNRKDLAIMKLLREYGAYEDIIDTFGVDINRYNNLGNTMLTEFVQNSDRLRVQYILNRNASVNLPTVNGLTPLMHAVFLRKLDVVKCLVERGADVNLRNNDGKTALMMAVENNFGDIVEYLINSGANVKARSNGGETAFGIALFHRYTNTANTLLKAMKGYVSLIEETMYGQESVVNWCISQRFNVNITEENGMTPLMIAAANNNVSIAKLLLASGADVNVKNEKGETALDISLSSKLNNMVDILMAAGAEIKEQDKKLFSLLEAARNGHFNIVKYCIDHNFNVDERSEVGVTPLMLASANGHKDIVKYLLKHGADFNLKEYLREYNALMFAIENGYQNIVKILLDQVKKVHQDSRKILLNHTSDLTSEKIKDLDEKSSERAAVHSYVNAKDKDGNNSLMIAVARGHIHQNHREIIKVLMDAGAFVYCGNDYRETPISIAKKHYRGAENQGKVKWAKIIRILSR